MWNSICEALTAFGTVAMAVTTWVVIRQNKQEHQDAIRPICELVPDKELAGPFVRYKIVQHYEEPNDPTKYFLVTCGVKNIGNGPAMNLRLVMRFSISNPVPLPQVEIQMLGANQSLPSPVKVPVFLQQDRFNTGNYEGAPGLGWELWLIYEDVFGNVFHTQHTKNPQEPWATHGKGDMNLHD